jgi:prepilin peptidase CpaA
MVLQILFVAVLPAIFITAAAWDLTSFTIPNVFPAALIALFVAFAAYALFTQPGVGIGDIGWHVAAGGIGLVAGLLFFALGWIGGGDAKLFAVACLWLGWDTLFEYVVLASVLGGVLTIALLTLRRVPLPGVLLGHGWLVKLTEKNSGIPYGVALSAAAIALLPSSELFRVAAAS